ncbi:hypothetical protein [Bifidobacterium bombi]|uniref:Uncharacterized protein n=1 Tax=Bifidobacterium bombi DSM 19703 TaxID=1341695 RepID=A0A086BNP0_9BIFI|nr:hypothetical protein [Bifidobacterium bombi]KFF30554.1 hypothetical protein BBOMB_1414 [Bifidobacterium bombi DSM 19703]
MKDNPGTDHGFPPLASGSGAGPVVDALFDDPVSFDRMVDITMATGRPQMNDKSWEQVDQEYSTQGATRPGRVYTPDREISITDLDDIFAGRPLADEHQKK